MTVKGECLNCSEVFEYYSNISPLIFKKVMKMKCRICGKELDVYEDKEDYKVVAFKRGETIIECKKHEEE